MSSAVEDSCVSDTSRFYFTIGNCPPTFTCKTDESMYNKKFAEA